MEFTRLKWQLAQKLEYKWWQNYLKKKDPEKYLAWKLNYWHNLLHLISEYLPEPVNQRILDAGCGPAGIFLALEGNTVQAIDPLLSKYRHLPHFRGDLNWVDFRQQTIESLDSTGSYDVIFCINAINHVDDISSCYDSLVRALKPGGTLVISTDAHKYAVLRRLFQLIPVDALHPIQLTISEYNTFLEIPGLTVLKNILIQGGNIFDYYVTIARKHNCNEPEAMVVKNQTAVVDL